MIAESLANPAAGIEQSEAREQFGIEALGRLDDVRLPAMRRKVPATSARQSPTTLFSLNSMSIF